MASEGQAVGWSTAEVARLAGVSARAVRYYHEVGLLPVPERRTNGYKSYGVAHLIRLIRIRRLTDLGFTLAQIAELDSPGPDADALFQSLDEEIAGRIQQLELIRHELPGVLAREVRGGLPQDFAHVDTDAQLTETDRATLFVLGRLLPEQRREHLKAWLSTTTDSDADDEFERLPADADEATRADLAERMLPAARTAQQHRASATSAPPSAAHDIGAALRDIYNAAQMDVLVRVSQALDAESPGQIGAGS